MLPHRYFARVPRRAGIGAALLAALLGLTLTSIGACLNDGMAVCKNGLRCPIGMKCTGDGTQCMPVDALCGDGVKDGIAGEQCDDGNRRGYDGCNATCTGAEICGNGIVERHNGESCDCGTPEDLQPGERAPECQGQMNNDFRGYCNLGCVPNCRDNKLDEDEECDDKEFNRDCLTEAEFDRGVPTCTNECTVNLDNCQSIGWRENSTALPVGNSFFDAWGIADGAIFAGGVVGDGDCRDLASTEDCRGTIFEYRRERGTWVWLDIVPEARYFEGVWGQDSNDVFAVGTGRTTDSGDNGSPRPYYGIVVRYDGISAQSVYELEGIRFASVWGADNSSDIWVVGDEGTVLRYNRQDDQWAEDDVSSTIDAVAQVDLYSVWGPSADEAYIVGQDGMILHYVDGIWSREAEGLIDTDLVKVWGIGERVFAVGDLGRLLVRDETGWSVTQTENLQDFYTVWGLRDDAVIAVGRLGAVALYDGESWLSLRPIQGQPDLQGVVSDGATGLAALDRTGGVWEYAFQSWTANLTPPSQQRIQAVWARHSGELYAAIANGAIFQFDGHRWTEASPASQAPSLHGLWGTPDGKVYAVGGDSTILERALDGTWSQVALPPETPKRILRSIWGTPEGNLFVVGDSDFGSETRTALALERVDGVWLIRETPDNIPTLRSVWGVEQATAEAVEYAVYAVGDEGTILSWNGTEWARERGYIGIDVLHQVWGSDPGNLYAVGEEGQIFKKNGATWLWQNNSPTTETLRGIWGSSGEDIYIVTDGGSIFYYDGNNWSPVRSPISQRLSGIWGVSNHSNNVQVLSFVSENAILFQLAMTKSLMPDVIPQPPVTQTGQRSTESVR